jgi:hypothetical protein
MKRKLNALCISLSAAVFMAVLVLNFQADQSEGIYSVLAYASADSEYGGGGYPDMDLGGDGRGRGEEKTFPVTCGAVTWELIEYLDRSGNVVFDIKIVRDKNSNNGGNAGIGYSGSYASIRTSTGTDPEYTLDGWSCPGSKGKCDPCMKPCEGTCK